MEQRGHGALSLITRRFPSFPLVLLHPLPRPDSADAGAGEMLGGLGPGGVTVWGGSPGSVSTVWTQPLFGKQQSENILLPPCFPPSPASLPWKAALLPPNSFHYM